MFIKYWKKFHLNCLWIVTIVIFYYYYLQCTLKLCYSTFFSILRIIFYFILLSTFSPVFSYANLYLVLPLMHSAFHSGIHTGFQVSPLIPIIDHFQSWILYSKVFIIFKAGAFFFFLQYFYWPYFFSFIYWSQIKGYLCRHCNCLIHYYTDMWVVNSHARFIIYTDDNLEILDLRMHCDQRQGKKGIFQIFYLSV